MTSLISERIEPDSVSAMPLRARAFVRFADRASCAVSPVPASIAIVMENYNG
jgi:hypothetical protein